MTFAREYFQHGDPRKAARAAGSKAAERNLSQVGSQLLLDPRTQAELEKLYGTANAKATQSVAETKAEVNLIIDEGIELARQGKPILTKRGETIYDQKTGAVLRQPDIPALLKGAELKGKTVAMFTDRQELTGEMDAMTGEELETFFLSALLSNPMLLERVCSEELVTRKVYELERRREDAASGESPPGDAVPESEPVSTASEATGVSPGRVH